VAQLLPGLGPQLAERLCTVVAAAGVGMGFGEALASFTPPAAARAAWPAFVELYRQLGDPATPWPPQVGMVLRFYQPHLERLYDDARVRLGDLEQLEQLAAAAPSREQFLSELALDPPEATGAEAGPPHLDEDYLILSTIHSAKGQEWDTVYLLSVADGCLPSDLATGQPAQIEEERRLLYVAMTRARNALTLVHPLRFFLRQQARHGDRHVFTPRTRFIPDSIVSHFARSAPLRKDARCDGSPAPAPAPIDVAARLRAQWR
jgi:DNA helicase-2/ATP-dependent DNA helicase PcrA